jgi:hypothetical protein
MPFYGTNPDTLMMNTIRLNVVKSKDSSYHVYRVRFSRGNNPDIAKTLASKIEFNVTQRDSLLILPKGFAVSKNEKFRNQQVLVVIEVPVGKRIELDHSVTDYNWFSVNFNRRRGFNIDWDDSWDYTYDWTTNTEYVMTPEGLERTDNLNGKDRRNGKFRFKADEKGVDIEIESKDKDKDKSKENKVDDNRYRYKKEDTVIDTARVVRTSELSIPLAAFSNIL